MTRIDHPQVGKQKQIVSRNARHPPPPPPPPKVGATKCWAEIAPFMQPASWNYPQIQGNHSMKLDCKLRVSHGIAMHARWKCYGFQVRLPRLQQFHTQTSQGSINFTTKLFVVFVARNLASKFHNSQPKHPHTLAHSTLTRIQWLVLTSLNTTLFGTLYICSCGTMHEHWYTKVVLVAVNYCIPQRVMNEYVSCMCHSC